MLSDFVLADSHCHLHLMDLNLYAGGIPEIISRAEAEYVKYFLCVAVSLEETSTLQCLADNYQNVFISIGVHPNEMPEKNYSVHELIKASQHPKVIAIGETGLDYYRSSGDLEWQKERFRTHIAAARTVNKPIIIHMREATIDTLSILNEEKIQDVGAVMHCFTENWETAKKALDLGCYISLAGVVTFKNAIALQEVAKNIPLERLLLETDCPYLAPVPLRGKPNEPAYMKYIAEFIANLRGISTLEIAENTTRNFKKLFKV